jgi:hypothetical protein
MRREPAPLLTPVGERTLRGPGSRLLPRHHQPRRRVRPRTCMSVHAAVTALNPIMVPRTRLTGGGGSARIDSARAAPGRAPGTSLAVESPVVWGGSTRASGTAWMLHFARGHHRPPVLARGADGDTTAGGRAWGVRRRTPLGLRKERGSLGLTPAGGVPGRLALCGATWLHTTAKGL